MKSQNVGRHQKVFGRTVLGVYVASGDDSVTIRKLKLHNFTEKYVQILHSSLGISKIHPKYAEIKDSSGRVRTAHPLCSRITLETTAPRVM